MQCSYVKHVAPLPDGRGGVSSLGRPFRLSLPHGGPLELEAVRVVDDPVEHRVGDGRLSYDLVP